MPLVIEGHSEAHLLAVAEKQIDKKTDGSTLLDRDAEDRIPKFSFDEFTLGRVLGRGGFCVVHEITKIELKNDDSPTKPTVEKMEDEHHIHNIVQDRHFMESHCIRQGKDCRYAIKRLQESSKQDTQTFINGVVDLAVEARFLAVIRHPNIIKMRAMANGPANSLSFFVVLDRLYDILSPRLIQWKKRGKGNGLKKLLTDRKGKKELGIWVERCTVAYDLACAMKYLHDLNVVYRDIKPDNIGFDVRGDVKVFDFGLAKEFNPANADSNGNYNLTGDTGSPRYMATEVALNQPYNEKCDVYSFSILMWQILSLETPFEGYTMSMFMKKVIAAGARPKCDDAKWPADLCDTMRSGWGKLSQRPSMEDVCSTLRAEINRHTDEEIVEIMDASRKSEMSLHREDSGSRLFSGSRKGSRY